jgi:hypothetical protein
MDQILKGFDRKDIIKATALYLVVAALWGLGGGVLAFAGGAIAGVVGVGTTEVLGQLSDEELAAINANGELAENRAALEQAQRELGQVSILATITGLVAIITAPIMLIVAFGLFQRKAWARQGTILVAGVGLVLGVLGLSGGFGSIISLLLSALVLYLYLKDEGIRLELAG